MGFESQIEQWFRITILRTNLVVRLDSGSETQATSLQELCVRRSKMAWDHLGQFRLFDVRVWLARVPRPAVRHGTSGNVAVTICTIGAAPPTSIPGSCHPAGRLSQTLPEATAGLALSHRTRDTPIGPFDTVS